MSHNFGPVLPDEPILFGASRPGYPSKYPLVDGEDVKEWTDFMRANGIVRVVCLLDRQQLGYYDDCDLLETYRNVFGADKVLSAPVPDFGLPSRDLVLDTVLPFVHEALRAGEKTVIHCSAGCGRTGFMLAACLVALRGLSAEEAIKAVSKAGRNALESGDRDGVDSLLNACQKWPH